MPASDRRVTGTGVAFSLDFKQIPTGLASDCSDASVEVLDVEGAVTSNERARSKNARLYSERGATLLVNVSWGDASFFRRLAQMRKIIRPYVRRQQEEDVRLDQMQVLRCPPSGRAMGRGCVSGFQKLTAEVRGFAVRCLLMRAQAPGTNASAHKGGGL